MATPSEASKLGVAMSRRSAQSPVPDAHRLSEAPSLDVTIVAAGSGVIICTPSSAGELTTVVIKGPTYWAVSKAKMLIEPSQRPTAKWFESSQTTS